MFERFTRKSLTATAAALLAALGVGGAALAQSSQSGTQTAPPAASQPKDATEVPGQESNAPENSATDPDNVQSGDQTGPETGRESATEQESGSEKVNDDGPGGHADEPANPNADHQFQGKE